MNVLTVCTLLAAIASGVLGRIAWFTKEQSVFFNFTGALLLSTAVAFYLLTLWYKRAKES
ncbi:hypothetical protein MKQ70_02535 [Chitinophaga sedimenti]|uniref:hypothetical protein n=1 Tax=Chitinophaga sedimenti TaxID=2033606 RepID=UPI0020048E1C|nr:hypothetical protein [Chitinophaga sedimenti]MCK7553944.1 hypothetical protein [Chitinophaga sedimenti]